MPWKEANQGISLLESLELKAQGHDHQLVRELLRNLALKYAETERRVALLNRELLARQAQLAEDLAAAGEIQRAMIPREPICQENFTCHWAFIPCESVAGDVFHVYHLGADRIGFYIIDVTGHGVPAAMVTASVAQFLHPFHMVRKKHGTEKPASPLHTIEALEREFPLERFQKLFSIVFGEIDLISRQVTFVNCGHPYPVVYGGNTAARFLEESGPLIGMKMSELFKETQITLAPGEKMILYSDGITECWNSQKEQYGEARLLQLLDQNSGCTSQEMVVILEADVREFQGPQPFSDDVTFFVFSLDPQD